MVASSGSGELFRKNRDSIRTTENQGEAERNVGPRNHAAALQAA